MKFTVLECVQQVLSAMSSDAVNAIGDTVESLQVADELRTTYYHMIGNIERPDEYDLISFESSGDLTLPTLMRTRDEVDHFKWVRYYDTSVVGQERYKDVCYLAPDKYIDKVTSYTGTNSTTVRIGE